DEQGQGRDRLLEDERRAHGGQQDAAEDAIALQVRKAPAGLAEIRKKDDRPDAEKEPEGSDDVALEEIAPERREYHDAPPPLDDPAAKRRWAFCTARPIQCDTAFGMRILRRVSRR